MRILAFMLSFWLLLTPAQGLAGQLYNFDQETRVRFAAKMCEADILMGEFPQLSGKIYIDRDAPEKSWVSVTIDAPSVILDKEWHGEDHIKTIVTGENFLNATNFSHITFKSTNVQQTSETTAMMTGKMTLVGETHPMKLEVTFHEDESADEKIKFSAYGTFKRSDWNIMYALDRIGIRRIGDEVQVLISATGTQN